MITSVGAQAGGTTVDNTTVMSRAYPANVAAGDLVVVLCWKITQGGADAFVAADCTKSAGTATIGAVSLDSSLEFDFGSLPDHVEVGIWSAIVTGAGSLTMDVGGMAAASYGGIASDELNSTIGWDAARVEAVNTGSDATDNVSTATAGSLTSAGAAAMYGVMVLPGSSAVQTITPDAAFTQLYEEQDDSSHQAGSAIRRIVSAGTTDSPDWALTDVNTGYCAAGVAYKEAAAAAPPAPTGPTNLMAQALF